MKKKLLTPDGAVRGMDLAMMSLLNAQERDEREFRELFALASDGFVFKVSYDAS